MRTVAQRELQDIAQELHKLGSEALNRASKETDSFTKGRFIGQYDGLERAAETIESFYNV